MTASCASCATRCATHSAKSLMLLVLRELREVFHPNVRARTRASHVHVSRKPQNLPQLPQLAQHQQLSDDCPATSRATTATAMSEAKKGAEAMPETAALVAELREWLGRDVVDRAIAAGQQARREFRALEASKGREAAEAWLARQRFPRGRFWAAEGDREVGIKVQP